MTKRGASGGGRGVRCATGRSESSSTDNPGGTPRFILDPRSRAVIEVVDGDVVVFGACSSDDLPFHIEWRHDRIVKL